MRARRLQWFRRRDFERPAHLPKAQLISIIKPRVEEISELVRDRLKQAGLPAHAGRRLVLRAGCQLTGMQAAVKRIVSGQVRIGRPLGIKGLPEVGEKPGFCRGCRSSDLSAGERYRAFPSIAAGGSARLASAWIHRAVGQWLKSSF